MLTRTPPTLRPYGFLQDGSAGRFMDRAALAIAADPVAQALLSTPAARVMSDIKIRVKSSGKPAIKAFYWSVQCPDQTAWGGLCARTLLAGPGDTRWIDLPDDPALPALAALRLHAGQWRVLRYVPLRRATLYHQPDATARIIKVKRTDRIADAVGRLAAAQMALGDQPGFTIPLLQSPSPQGTFALTLCPGVPFRAGYATDLPGLLRRIGQMHAQLHQTAPRGLPAEQRGDGVENLNVAAALRPDLARHLAPLTRILRDRPAASAPVLCHGDFCLDQILLDQDRLSLVDFDLCHGGEAAADIARFLVELTVHTDPGLADGAAAYLAGYTSVRPLPDMGLLRWYRADAAIAHLLVSLRKDRVQPQRIARLLAQIDPADIG